MSCFTKIATRLVDLDAIEAAAADLGYETRRDTKQVRGWSSQTTTADAVLQRKDSHYDIGAVREKDGTYGFVSDWSMSGVRQQDFVDRLSQRYSYRRVVTQAKASGFVVAKEKVDEAGAIRLVLRKFA